MAQAHAQHHHPDSEDLHHERLLLPFITCVRELTLFMLLCSQTKIITTMLDYFDEMGLYAFSSGINLILIVFILICNALINKLTGASLDKGIGGE